MRTRNMFLAAAIGLGVATLLGSTALAAPVSVRDAAGGDGIFASSKLHQNVSLKVTNVFSNFVNYDSGVFGLEQSNASPTFPNNTYTALITYCLEIGQSIGQLPFTYQSQAIATALASGSVVPPSANAAQAAERISRLWAASFADSIDVNSSDFEGLSGISTSERAAAFQVAIWELAVDNGVGSGAPGNEHGLLSGNFQIESGGGSQGDVLRMANAYLTIAKGTGALANIEALADNTRQDLIRPGGGGNGQSVPAPGSLALFGAGMIALAAVRRLKKA